MWLIDEWGMEKFRADCTDMFDLGRIADVYGSGEIRLTVEQNIIIPNISTSRIEAFSCRYLHGWEIRKRCSFR